MSKKATIVLAIVAAVLLIAGARGGGSWLTQKIRALHGIH